MLFLNGSCLLVFYLINLAKPRTSNIFFLGFLPEVLQLQLLRLGSRSILSQFYIWCEVRVKIQFKKYFDECSYFYLFSFCFFKVFVRCTPKSKTVRSKIHTEVFDICCQTGFQKLYQLEKDNPQELKPVLTLTTRRGGWDGREGPEGEPVPTAGSC